MLGNVKDLFTLWHLIWSTNLNMRSPILAPALKPGDTIAFLSPSARLNDKLPLFISRATALFNKRGYNVLPIYTTNHDNTSSGIQASISTRLSEIRSAFTDPSVKAIICTIGGTTFTELLPALIPDIELQQHIRDHPKIVVGYSDITGLHWFLHALTGLRTFYGPGIIPELGLPDSIEDNPEGPLAFCWDNLLRTIEAASLPEGENATSSSSVGIGDIPRSREYYPRPVPFNQPNRTTVPETAPTPKWTWIRPGKSTGRLFGGCLTVVVRLGGIGPIVPNWQGRIVFLETAMGEGDDLEKGNPIERVRAGFADLIAQGVFDEAVGLVIGRPFGYNNDARQRQYIDVIKGLFCEEGSVWLRIILSRFCLVLILDIRFLWLHFHTIHWLCWIQIRTGLLFWSLRFVN